MNTQGANEVGKLDIDDLTGPPGLQRLTIHMESLLQKLFGYVFVYV